MKAFPLLCVLVVCGCLLPGCFCGQEPEASAVEAAIASQVGLAVVRPLQPQPLPDEPQPGEPATPRDVIPDVPTHNNPECDCLDCKCAVCICGETDWKKIAQAKGWPAGQAVLVCVDREPPADTAGAAVWRGKASAAWAAGIHECVWDGTRLLVRRDRDGAAAPAARDPDDGGRRRLFRRRAGTGPVRAACVA